MSKELVISASQHETKLAILEDDQLVEVYFQRSNEYSLAGSIHKGRVTRVLPGMQSAFVDLGLERDTFLYVSDFFEESEEYDRIGGGKDDQESRPERGQRGQRAPVSEPRPERAAEPAPTGAEAGSETPSGPEPAPASIVSTERQAERPEDGDGRDRRGRRSRRRRNRGRGFPESKYASETRPVAAVPQTTAAEEQEQQQAVEASDGEMSILPGESLAKYRRSNIEPLDEQEEEEIRDAQEVDEQTQPEDEDETQLAAEPVSEPATEEITAAFSAPPARFETEARAASAPEHQADRAEALAEAQLARIEEDEAEDLAEAERVADAEVLAEAEIEAEAEQVSAAEAQGELPSGSVPAGEPPREAPAQLSANVREQGGRYMHRMPRRMRRKMRSGGPAEGRPDSRLDQQHRGEVVSIGTAGDSAARSEQRPAARPTEKSGTPSITDLLKEGQEIIVQIAKEPLGQKGARITSHIALPGRYVVYMPTLEHMGVSRKISSDDERLRLKRILQAHRAGIPGGLIIRTAGEGKSEDEIAADINFLFNLWTDIRQKAEKKPAPLLLHHDLDIVQRTLRDQLTENFKAIWVDNEEVYESILRFVERFQPALVARVKLYTRQAPIFDSFNITAELEKALRPKVWLKSGGHIVINQTEALVAIDVNTGKYVGKSNRLEDTIVKTNTEAVKEIVRQVRLRDLGGIIVVDFIDMDERKNRQKVMQVLEEAMRADRAPNKILQFNDFGLVAITRKRVKQSLERTLCAPCPYCEGAGYVKSVQTVIGEILQEAHKIVPAVADQKDVVLRVHPEVAKVLKSNHNKYLEELEEILRRPVLVKGDLTVHQEKFDLA